MFRAQDLPIDPERFLVKRFGFSVLARRLVEQGQVNEAVRRVGMFLSSHLPIDPQRFQKERLGFGVLAHSLVQQGQVIEAVRRVGMFRAQDLLPGSGAKFKFRPDLAGE